jgi:predicted nuclease of predicted toxin-antitoxin system
VNGILADANCEGHLALLLRLFQEGWRHDVWEVLHLTPVSLSDLGLQADASDREVWEACRRAQVILLTANRNDDGPESLEATIQQHKTPASLPVFTLANDQRVLRDRLYAEVVAERLLELLFGIDSYRGTGRLYLP